MSDSDPDSAIPVDPHQWRAWPGAARSCDLPQIWFAGGIISRTADHASVDEPSDRASAEHGAALWATGRPDDPRRGASGKPARGSQSFAVAHSARPLTRGSAEEFIFGCG